MTLIIILISIVLIIGLFIDPKAILGLIGIVLGFILLFYGSVYLMVNVMGFLGGGRFGAFLVLGLLLIVLVNMLLP